MNTAIATTRNVAVARLSYDARPYPLALHHWTTAEFVSFLDKHRFPGNTYDDRIATRRQAVIDAAAKGLYVPDEVLGEDPSLAPEAHAQRESKATLACYLDAQVSACAEQAKALEKALGYWSPAETYYARVKDVLRSALTRTYGDIRKPLRWQQGWELELSVDRGRRPDQGPFGLWGGRQQALVVRGIGTGASHRVEWDYVNDALTELLQAGEVSYDQVWLLTGTGWSPALRHVRLAA